MNKRVRISVISVFQSFTVAHNGNHALLGCMITLLECISGPIAVFGDPIVEVWAAAFISAVVVFHDLSNKSNLLHYLLAVLYHNLHVLDVTLVPYGIHAGDM